MKRIRVGLLIASIGSVSSPVSAQPYVGISLGQAYFSDIKASINSPTRKGSQKLDIDDNSLAIKLLTGYEFNQFIAIEGSIGGYDALDGPMGSLGDMRFFAFQGKATLPITQKLNTFAKAGFSYYSARFESIYGDVSDDSVSGKYGLGMEFRITDNFSAAFEWDYMEAEVDIFKLGDASATMSTKISVFSLGAAYRF
ncbi:outer membrane beta-barrel protein [Vibrio bathopelagicus]|uniref:outer membrane beta-barrel protein n=1 Tax=Vibrio bathopelagicus TaxID=2777577 RepID=UPI001864C60D|nr:outer membrane beta-barrel protein [Vibrio bathopelagicus]